MTARVAVIITARDAEATIGAAVRSALTQPEVSEVVLVDDASTDATAEAALVAAGIDPRLTVLRQTVNIGPAAARNLAIARSSAPFIAILDADDYLLPGRFAPLLAQEDWDLIADNIVFFPEGAGPVDPGDLPLDDGLSEPLDLAGFVEGNIARTSVRRGELGFLKPVVRRSVLPKPPVYDPALRLGEDYDLYVRLLLAGARFRLSRHVGYAAGIRANSLSGSHRTADLAALLGATGRHLAAASDHPAAQQAMRRHRRQLSARYLLRAFLDRKSEAGIGAAVVFALSPPSNLLPIATGVARDKLAPRRKALEQPVRLLLPVQPDLADGKRPAAHAPASSRTTGKSS